MSSKLIVVGVDGSEGGRRALRWALREAARSGAAVEAVTAWSWDDIDLIPMAPGNRSEAEEAAAKLQRREVGAVLHEWLATPPPLARKLVEGDPVRALTNAAADADMLVLGSHGHSRLRHLALGSVSEECVRRGACPVVVVPVPHPTPRRHAEPAVPAH